MKKALIALLIVINLNAFSNMVNLPIKSIEVINNQKVSADLIKEKLNLKEGDTFSTDKVLRDFNELKATGYFKDVVLQPESYDGGVKLIVDVLENENVDALLREKGIAANTEREDTDKSITLSSVKFVGNTKISSSELASVTQLKPGEHFSRSRVEEAQRKLLASGYFATVKPDVKINNGNMDLVFDVTENPIVKNIVVTGNRSISTQSILSALSTKVGEVQN